MKNSARRIRTLFFSILLVFVPAKVLHGRCFQCFSCIFFVPLDPPLCGPGTLTTRVGRPYTVVRRAVGTLDDTTVEFNVELKEPEPIFFPSVQVGAGTFILERSVLWCLAALQSPSPGWQKSVNLLPHPFCGSLVLNRCTNRLSYLTV